MSSQVLFVFEGEKAENQIANSLTKYFISENSVIQCAYCNNIYHLLNELSKDDDLDTFSLLKANTKNVDILSDYKRKDFAEIYLFFDYDGHDSSANDQIVREALTFFNEETETGKLFVSYPMVEAIKHKSELIDFKDLKVKAKENVKYKQQVDSETTNELKQISKYTKDVWIHIIDLHLSKANFIVTGVFSLPTRNIYQIEIFLNQLKKYIEVDSTVSVLSSFPIFILDYYGVDYINTLLSE